MPKASEKARRERRRAEERLSTAYGWPTRRRRELLGLPWPAAVALIVIAGAIVVIGMGWHL